jgi:uncharacterized protein YidB (DUF937 family)
MGLLDSVIGGLMSGSPGGGASPMAGVLMNLLGGNQASMGGAGVAGGLGGLVSSFEQAGLGRIMQSWIGTGANQPVSPQQLQSVFGEDQVHSMASQAGMEPHDFLSQLSQHLPNAVNGMTPEGHVPYEETISV